MHIIHKAVKHSKRFNRGVWVFKDEQGKLHMTIGRFSVHCKLMCLVVNEGSNGVEIVRWDR